MKEVKNILLLVGSPHRNKSTSNSLGQYIIDNINEESFNIEKLYLQNSIKLEERKDLLINKVNDADIIILAYPLYMDTLPAVVIKALELIEDNIIKKKRKFISICNCGYPKEKGMEVSQDICENFAENTGMEWLGSLSLAKGPLIMGKPIDKLGFMTGNIKIALDLTIKALEENEKIPKSADQNMKMMIPNWLYVFMVNNIMRFRAIKDGGYGKYKNNLKN